MNQLSPIGWAIRPIRKYAALKGRAPRSEYWWYVALWAILFGIAQAIDLSSGTSPRLTEPGWVTWALCVALLVPSVAVSVRRLHDVGRSGWYVLWYILPFVGTFLVLVELASPGDYGPNAYGPDPLSSRSQFVV